MLAALMKAITMQPAESFGGPRLNCEKYYEIVNARAAYYEGVKARGGTESETPIAPQQCQWRKPTPAAQRGEEESSE